MDSVKPRSFFGIVLSNEQGAKQLQHSRLNTKMVFDFIAGPAEFNNHKYRTGKADTSD